MLNLGIELTPEQIENEKLIDRFALAIAQGMLASSPTDAFPGMWSLAFWSYKYAEIMVNFRNLRYGPKCTDTCTQVSISEGIALCTKCCKTEVKPCTPNPFHPEVDGLSTQTEK